METLLKYVGGSAAVLAGLIWVLKVFVVPKLQAKATSDRLVLLGLPFLDELTDQLVEKFPNSKLAKLANDAVDEFEKKYGIEDISQKRIIKSTAMEMLKQKTKAQ